MINKSGFCVGVSGSSWESLLETLYTNQNVNFSYVASFDEMLSLPFLSSARKDHLLALYRGEIREQEARIKDYKVDAAILAEYLETESICMELADRMDQGYSFSRGERERLYLLFLDYWLNLVAQLKPSFIIFSTTPHSIAEYVLYSVAKKQGIPVIMFMQLVAIERVIYYYDYKQISESYLTDYQKLRSINQEVSLPDDLQEYLNRYNGDSYRDAMPAYLRDRLDQSQSSKKVMPLKILLQKILKFQTYFNGFQRLRQKLFNVLTKLSHPVKGPHNYLKMPYEPMERHEGLTPQQWHAYKAQAAKYKAELLNNYNLHCGEFNSEKKYIYMPLHFQPERTTCPEGARYSNQLMMLRVLSQSIPDDWVIYVKENPSQLLTRVAHGERGRYAYYYDDLANINKVTIVSLTTDTFQLIDNSQAVATLTGTSGWEAILRGKRALCFGYTWYTECAGAIKVTDLHSCRQAIVSLRDAEPISDHEIHCFFSALDKHSFRGFLNVKRYPDKRVGEENNFQQLLPILSRFIERCEL